MNDDSKSPIFYLNHNSQKFLQHLPEIFARTQQRFSHLLQAKKIHYERVFYENLSMFYGTAMPIIQTDEDRIPSSLHVGLEIPIRIYHGVDRSRTILYIHGGGWTLGSLNTHDQLCKNLCQKTGYNIIAVDYRLAPEHKHPSQHEDIHDVYEWICRKQDLSDSIIMIGDSGGGQLAATYTIKRILEHREHLPSDLVLFYPAVDLHIDKKSRTIYDENFFLTREAINQFIKNFLSEEDLHKAGSDPTISPIVAQEEIMHSFPKTLVIVAQCDPLTEQINIFINKLKSANVKVASLELAGTLHGFAQFGDLFKNELDLALEFIHEQL